jgi:hypothetical protein
MHRLRPVRSDDDYTRMWRSVRLGALHIIMTRAVHLSLRSAVTHTNVTRSCLTQSLMQSEPPRPTSSKIGGPVPPLYDRQGRRSAPNMPRKEQSKNPRCRCILYMGPHAASENHASDCVPEARSSAAKELLRSASSSAREIRRRRKNAAPARTPDADELKSSMHPEPPTPQT